MNKPMPNRPNIIFIVPETWALQTSNAKVVAMQRLAKSPLP
jgi:hypothetical protein